MRIQSIVTPSVGLEQPQCVAWEPCFAQDLEWTFLHALGRLGTPGGTSAYFRLSTRPVDQAWTGAGVLYFARLSARRTASRMSRIVGTPEYRQMTIRSWTTTTKLLELLEARGLS